MTDHARCQGRDCELALTCRRYAPPGPSIVRTWISADLERGPGEPCEWLLPRRLDGDSRRVWGPEK